MQSNWQNSYPYSNSLQLMSSHFSPQTQYKAALLQTIIYINLVVTVIFTLYGLFSSTRYQIIGTVASLLIIALNLWAFSRIRNRKIDAAGRVVIGLDWLGIGTGKLWCQAGLYSSAMMGFMVLLVIAVLILERRDQLICFGGTVFWFVLMLGVELSGNLPDAPFKDLPLRMIVLISVAIVLFLTLRYHLYASKKSEKQITRLKVDAERYKVQRELTQDLAHDVRTPLSTMQTTTYLIRQRMQRDMPIDESLDTLEGQVQRINSMIEDLFPDDSAGCGR